MYKYKSCFYFDRESTSTIEVASQKSMQLGIFLKFMKLRKI